MFSRLNLPSVAWSWLNEWDWSIESLCVCFRGRMSDRVNAAVAVGAYRRGLWGKDVAYREFPPSGAFARWWGFAVGMISIASPLSLVVAWSPIVIGLQRCFSCIGCARSIGILFYLGRGVARGETRNRAPFWNATLRSFLHNGNCFCTYLQRK